MTTTPARPHIGRRRFLRNGVLLGAGLSMGRALPAVGLVGDGGAGQTVAVLGGGVAGLTAAHELALRGFEVSVYERKALGGKARSIPVAGTGSGGRRDLPAEHGFRAEFGFYQNLPDTLGKIPVAGNRNGVFDNMVPVTEAQLAREGAADLTLPIDWRRWRPDPASFATYLQSMMAVFESGGMAPHEVAFFVKQVAMYFTSCEARRFGQWEYVNWWDYTRAAQMSEDYQKQFADGLTRNLAAAKPRDMSVNSTGLVGESFAYSLMQRPDAPQGSPDRVLNAPTNEAWIDPWVAELARLGVVLHVGATVEQLTVSGGQISQFVVRDPAGRAEVVTPDWVVCAVPVERARALFAGAVAAVDPSLESLGGLRTEWMNGVIFHLDREVPVCHGHVSYVDSPFALTSVSQAQHWDRDISQSYGDGRARESFSAIISDFSAPGMVYGKPAWSLTHEQICDEVWAQLKAHLGDQLRDEWVVSRFVDPAIHYPAELAGGERIAENDEPLLINTPGSWDDRPGTTTAISNLVLAGDYVRNTMNVATMESACETGRLAAQAIVDAAGIPAEGVEVFERWVPPENELLKQVDEQRYRLGLPHVLDTDLERLTDVGAITSALGLGG